MIVRWTRRLEDARALDGLVRAIEPSIRGAFGTGRRAWILRGQWLGHTVHPVLTDLVLGTWTSASVLDLVGGPAASAPARRLIGTGLLRRGPDGLDGVGGMAPRPAPGSKRVGLVHAAANGLAIGLYAGCPGSPAAADGSAPAPGSRWRGRRSRGSGPAWGAASPRCVGIGSRHPAYRASPG